jgi:hypothetical protein
VRGCPFNRITVSYSIDRFTQDFFIDVALGSDATSGPISGFLNDMPVMSTCPLPGYFVSRRGLVQTLPPLMIGLAPESAAHCFDHVT